MHHVTIYTSKTAADEVKAFVEEARLSVLDLMPKPPKIVCVEDVSVTELDRKHIWGIPYILVEPENVASPSLTRIGVVPKEALVDFISGISASCNFYR